MNVRAARVAVLAVLTLAMRPAWAPIWDFFPGLDSLVHDSSAIIVAQVVTLPATMRMSTFDDRKPQDVTIAHVLKGDYAAGTRRTVQLRSGLYPIATYGRVGDYRLGERYVLFLSTGDDGELEVSNTSGTAFWISTHRDLATLPRDDIRAAIALLLQDTLDDLSHRQQELQQRVTEYLNPVPPSRHRSATPAPSNDGWSGP